jgi:DNA polymerase-3 subunit chi
VTEVWFYHLEQTALDQALPELLEKTLARGWRALVRSPVSGRLQHLDDWLWRYRDDSFLAHGLADGTDPARQPVLLSPTPDNPNGAEALFLLDDAEPGDLSAYARCLILFEGRDEAAVAAARQRWREIKAAGHAASYWRQSEQGAWRKEGG